jgi:heterodisulfide reductase subunit A
MNKVIIIGGGIGGLQAALELADLGHYVYLVEEKPFLGGLMARIHKTYPSCFCCNLYPKLSACASHFNIEVLTQTQVKEIKGEVGNFKVTLVKYPHYVNDKCTACGICASNCPVEVKDPLLGDLYLRKAIYLPHPSALPNKYVLDTKNCLFFKNEGCKKCEEICPLEAINLNLLKETLYLNVASIVFASGANLADASAYEAYNYLRLPSVITSMDFERLMKLSIATYGYLVRPSDRAKPTKIAWLQCVGSRDMTKCNESCEHGYCSSVCCMYALKEAIMAKKYNEAQGTIFFMDLRTSGKEGEQYLAKAKEAGVRFVRSRVHALAPAKAKQGVIVKYTSSNGTLMEEEFDLAVLSLGFHPSPKTIELAQKMGLSLNNYHFIATDSFTPVNTSKAGVYVCGVFQEPKDILETTTQASAVSMEVSLLSDLSLKRETTPTTPFIKKGPRLGVFVCQCQGNITNNIETGEILEEIGQMPQVVCAKAHLSLCSLEGRQYLKENINEYGLDRIVVAACTPRLYEMHFKKVAEEAGLNPYLVELVNLREQCVWVHSSWQKAKTKKTKELIKMTIAKIMLAKPLAREKSIIKTALVIGGGIAGLTSALYLAKGGFKVYLIEKTSELGGIAQRLYHTWKGDDIKVFLNGLIDQVKNHPLIDVLLETQILKTKGEIGHFTTQLKTSSGSQEIDHGIIIIAIGGKEGEIKDYLYGKHSHILSLLETEQMVAKEDKLLLSSKTVVFIQCVGSRNEERPYCSRVCCSQALKNAIKLKEKKPDLNIYILYRDIRTYGFREDLYRKARTKGIVFIPYDLDKRPKVEIGKNRHKLMVEVHDPLLGEEIVIEADFISLALPLAPASDNKKLAEVLAVPLDQHGFFKESLNDLSLVNTWAQGVFICGLAQGPKFVDETITQTMAAAAHASKILSQDSIELCPIISQVVEENCDGCGYCIEPCPYHALSLFEYIKSGEIKKTAEVNPSLCQGCGTCQATCPKKGIYIPNYSLDQFLAMIDTLILPT